ncbi:MAG: ABC transporter permease [Clostridiales bacterium]|nr:ABC transporter permease [Clostridiales bacterium]
MAKEKPRAFDTSLFLGLPGIALILLFFVLPYLNMLYLSVMKQVKGAPYLKEFTLGNYAQILSDPYYFGVILLTLRLAFIAVVITLILAYPLAYHLSSIPGRRKGLLLTLILSPLLVGEVVRSYGWLVLLADEGLVNQGLRALGWGTKHLIFNQTGVVIGLVHIYLPFMVLALLGSLESINPDLALASRSLGASKWSTFWRITFPLSLPGIVSGTVLVFVLSASAYVVPSLLGKYNVLTAPMLAVQMVTDLFNWPLGSAFTVVFFVTVVALLGVYLLVTNRLLRRVMG